jgi:hypothetical protein
VAVVGSDGARAREALGPPAVAHPRIAGAHVATFPTFLPSIVFLFAGAPFVATTHGNLRVTAPLAGITAAVVGVVVSVAVFFARHVFFAAGAAVAGGARALMTLNRADFPSRTLARHGLILREPDGFLTELHLEGWDIAGVARDVQERAERDSGTPRPLRPLLKRSYLPRLGKALAGARQVI